MTKNERHELEEADAAARQAAGLDCFTAGSAARKTWLDARREIPAAKEGGKEIQTTEWKDWRPGESWTEKRMRKMREEREQWRHEECS